MSDILFEYLDSGKLMRRHLSKRSELKKADSTSPVHLDSYSLSKEASLKVPSILSSRTKFLSRRPSITGTLQEPPNTIASFGRATI